MFPTTVYMETSVLPATLQSQNSQKEAEKKDTPYMIHPTPQRNPRHNIVSVHDQVKQKDPQKLLTTCHHFPQNMNTPNSAALTFFSSTMTPEDSKKLFER